MSAVSFEDFSRVAGVTLHDDQRRVVTAPAQPQRVAAGAGTGKTTSMALRVAWLVASGAVEARDVIGLTFTTKAAASLHSTMRSALHRWHEQWEGEAADELGAPLVMTYHAFAGRIIAEHGVRLGYEPNATMLVDGARHRLAFDVVCRATDAALVRSGLGPATVTGYVLALDDALTDLGITPAALQDFDDRQIEFLLGVPDVQVLTTRMIATSEQRRALTDLVVEFRAAKKARDVLDFADQTRLAGELVSAFPEIAQHWRDGASVVLLDEYQDTSIAQRRLLQAIFGAGHPITAVGDASQAIYGWRGASVANMREFAEHFDARGAEHALNVSYRSGPAILAVANALSRGVPDRSGELEPGNPERGSGLVTCGLFRTRDEEHAWIVERIRSMGARHIAWQDIAVLASTGAELTAIRRLLDTAGIPTQLHGAAGLLSEPAVVDIRAMLDVIQDPTANRSVVRILAGPRWRLGPRDLAALGHRAAALVGRSSRDAASTVSASLDAAVVGSDPAEALSLLEAVFDPGDRADYSPECWTRLAEFADVVRALMAHAEDPVPDLIGRVIRVTGLDVEVLLSEDFEADRLALAGLMDLAADFSRQEGGGTLGAFLARLADAERFDVDLPLDDGSRGRAVQLMTIHKAKGLEFPHVFVPSMSDRAFPSGKSRSAWPTNPSEVPLELREDMRSESMPVFPDPQRGPRGVDHDAYLDWLKEREFLEARRLAYVAVTRAELTLAVTGHWWGSTQRDPRGPSPFLIEVRDAISVLPEDWAQVVVWEPAPEDGEHNPALVDDEQADDGVPWPTVPRAARTISEAATLVRRHLLATPSESVADADTPAELTSNEREEVARWDADLNFLVREAREQRSGIRSVRLPESVSASTFMRAHADPQGLAAELARPMPRRPSPAARRGTSFHNWVERRFGQATLIDLDDLPGAVDSDRTDASMAELQAAFERSPYAVRQPVATEFPFGIVIDGRVVRGRIDAVFAVDGNDPAMTDVEFDVVDWKTGRGRGIDPLQLAIYRLAWARHVGVAESQVGAAFLLVETGEVLRPDSLPTLG